MRRGVHDEQSFEEDGCGLRDGEVKLAGVTGEAENHRCGGCFVHYGAGRHRGSFSAVLVLSARRVPGVW